MPARSHSRIRRLAKKRAAEHRRKTQTPKPAPRENA